MRNRLQSILKPIPSSFFLLGDTEIWETLRYPDFAVETLLLLLLFGIVCFSSGVAFRGHLVNQEHQQTKATADRLALESKRLRAHIAQDIHDGVGAYLSKISLTAYVAARLPDIDPVELRSRIQKLGYDAHIAACRLSDIVFAIHPDFNHFSEMQAYFRENASQFWNDTMIDPVFHFRHSEVDPVVHPDVKQQLLFIFREAQTNIAKHANASTVYLDFYLHATDRYLLEIKDDGNGFVTDEIRVFAKGLSGMKRRASLIDATISFASAPGAGTVVRLEGCLSLSANT